MAENDEWEIENFSCWNGDIHSDSLNGWNFGLPLDKFYPRGFGGKGNHLVLRILQFEFPSDGKVSFVGSDGYVFCETEADQYDRRIFIGPKFEEVVARIKRNEPKHKDRLILRWKTPQGKPSSRLRTVIDVSHSQFFQIKPEMFDSNEWKPISNFQYTFRNETMELILVRACKTGSTFEDTKIKFALQSYATNKYLARISTWKVNGGNIIQKHEDDCILDKRENRILPYEIPFKDLFEKGVLTIIRLKVISGRVYQDYCFPGYMLPPDIGITDLFCERNSLESTSKVNSYPTRESTSVSPKRELQPENAVNVLTEDLMSLYQDHDFSDFELRCGTHSFPTHRAILSSRSPVLKAMLSGDMKEAASGHVDVEDLDPHTLGRFLAFLYSGTSEDLEWEGALKLYYAADKYQVSSLRGVCAAVLRTSVSLESVCDILSLSDKHQDAELRSVAYDFILENFNEVLGSENWEKFMSSNSLLAVKTVTHFAKNKYVQKK